MKVSQSCTTLCDSMDYTTQGILQARILEWVAFPFSRGFSQPRDRIQVSHIAGRFFTRWATRETPKYLKSFNFINFSSFYFTACFMILALGWLFRSHLILHFCSWITSDRYLLLSIVFQRRYHRISSRALDVFSCYTTWTEKSLSEQGGYLALFLLYKNSLIHMF